MTEEAVLSSRKLIQAVGRMVPISEECYLSLIRDLASNLQAVQWGAGATTVKLSEREAKLSELDLNGQ